MSTKLNKPTTEYINAEDLHYPMEIVMDINHDKKTVMVYPVWKVTWCDCWSAHDSEKDTVRKDTAGYINKEGKKVYDEYYALSSNSVRVPHTFYCNKPDTGKLSKLHIKVASLDLEFQQTWGTLTYNKSNKVPVLLNEGSYKVQTWPLGPELFRNIDHVRDLTIKWYNEGNFQYFEEWHNIDEKTTLEEAVSICVYDASQEIQYIQNYPVGKCTTCWYNFERKGIDMWENARWYTVSEMVAEAIKFRLKFRFADTDKFKKLYEDPSYAKEIGIDMEEFKKSFPTCKDALKGLAEDEAEWNALLKKAKKGKATRLEYFKMSHSDFVKFA